jgi:LysM repeat protein
MVKPTLLAAAMATAMIFPNAVAATELEELRALCLEQERQIRLLEQENTQLRSLAGQARVVESTPAPKPATSSPSTTGAATLNTAATRESDAGTGTYIVKPGDSIARIARLKGSTPAIIARLNGLKEPWLIQPGQKLKLPDSTAQAPASTAQTPTAAAQAPATTPALPAAGGRTHTIRQGDTFASIARKYKLSTNALIAANPEIKPNRMRIGQIVRLDTGSSASGATTPKPSAPAAVSPYTPTSPVTPRATTPTAPATPSSTGFTTPSSPTSPAPRTPSPTAPASDPYAPSTSKPPAEPTEPKLSTKEPKLNTITTDGQMTFAEFARKHGSTVERLNALNALSLDADTVLAKGSELYVPAE